MKAIDKALSAAGVTDEEYTEAKRILKDRFTATLRFNPYSRQFVIGGFVSDGPRYVLCKLGPGAFGEAVKSIEDF